MDILFISGFAIITEDPATSRAFYLDTLGLPLEVVGGDYIAMDGFDGAKHFGVWPLADAANACFGQSTWPSSHPVPNASIEFEVLDVAAAAASLEEEGHELLHGVRTEPWGQVIARLMSPEGVLVGVCYTPWNHEN